MDNPELQLHKNIGKFKHLVKSIPALTWTVISSMGVCICLSAQLAIFSVNSAAAALIKMKTGRV